MIIISLISQQTETNFNKAVQFKKEKKIRLSATAAKSPQSCPTLCDPRDGSPPGSSVHGIFQARVLEWAAIAHHYLPVNPNSVLFDGGPQVFTDSSQ